MLPFFWYMLKVIICSGILFGYYWLFLRNKIFHRYNRFYLLASLMLSLLLPLLKINFWQPAADTNQAIRVLQAVSAGDEYMNNIVLTARKSHWSIEQLYPVVYILVSLILFIVMLRTLFLIRTLLKKYPLQRLEDVAFVNTEDDSTPFSFLKYIFWNSSIDIGTKTGRQIFKHEVAHIQEKHSHDKLFINIILIFCWCNPFFWLYRKELNMIHEFIADKMAVEDSDTAAFASMILQAAYPKQQFDLTNNFFYSPIKRRLLMLTKNKNPKVNYIGRIMVLPLAVLVFAAFTFKTKNNTPIYNGKKITVVIDAGHGGQDAGAIGADGTLEKDITLTIAKKVKELNSNDAIEIVLVRESDVFMSPAEKAAFAKNKNADLFISLHVDNGPKEPANTKTGMAVFVAKDEFKNAAESKVLASYIVNEFTNNYGLTVKTQLNQHQIGVLILQANTCPAVLIEAGFINNEKDLSYLKTSAAKETIAKNVLAGIEKYFVTKPAIKNIIDTLPLPAKQQWEKAAGKASRNDSDTFDYYKKYGGEIIYKGQKIKSVFIRSSDNKAVVEFINGKQMIMTQAEAFKAKIIMPPPPPPPPPPGMYPDDKRPISLQKNGLVVVDGVIQDESYVLDDSNIQSVNVIKGDEAIAKYGERGKYGVIEVISNKVTYTEGIVFTTPFVDSDKKSVFYIGINNPFSVSVPNVKPEELVVNMSQGTRSGSNGNFIARVSSIGEITITLSKRDGTKIPVSFTVKVKRVPDPTDPDFPEGLKAKTEQQKVKEVSNLNNIETNERTGIRPGVKYADASIKLFVGDYGGGRISLDELKSQKELNVNGGYSFVSADVYFSYPESKIVRVISLTSTSVNVMNESINRCTPGCSVIFDKVLIKDKNGEVKMVLNPPGFAVFDKSNAETNKNDQPNNDKNIVFTIAEVGPQFTGGNDAWAKYLRENLKAATPVEEGWKAGKYVIVVQFIVHTDGTVSDVTTENYPGSKTALHCIDVIKKAPKWQPALQNGRKVNAYKKQPITFVIEE